MNEQQLSELQDKLDYRFINPQLLKNALTHSSYANENIKKGISSNERLEFLGDSLLGMNIAFLIFNNDSAMTEGKMTKLRAELVCERSLAALATELDLGKYLSLGRGEDNGGGRSRPSILADSFEAILAAIFLDGGYEPVEKLISVYFKPRLEQPLKSYADYKTALQETVHVKPGQTLLYNVVREFGPDHDKSFTIEVNLNGKTIGTGSGKTKKNAEQEAARVALETVKDS